MSRFRDWMAREWERTLRSSNAFRSTIRGYERISTFRFSDLKENDWRYFWLTCAWSVMICEGIYLVLWVIFTEVGRRPLGDFLPFVGPVCHIAVVSSICTGLIRRGALEHQSAHDMTQAMATYFVNLCVWIFVAFVGSIVTFLVKAALGQISSENLYSDLIVSIILGIPMLGIQLGIGSLLLSPLLVPAILASQSFMTAAARRNRRPSYA